MRFCLGEIDKITFRMQAAAALQHMQRMADCYLLRLLFRHLTWQDIDGYSVAEPGPLCVDELVEDLSSTFCEPKFALHQMDHMGFKDHTEGPPASVPILL